MISAGHLGNRSIDWIWMSSQSIRDDSCARVTVSVRAEYHIDRVGAIQDYISGAKLL